MWLGEGAKRVWCMWTKACCTGAREGCAGAKQPITSFETKNGLRSIFPCGEKSYIFLLSATKTPFSQTLRFMGNWPIWGKRESNFQGKTISLGGKILPPREMSPNFPLRGKILPQKMFREGCAVRDGETTIKIKFALWVRETLKGNN